MSDITPQLDLILREIELRLLAVDGCNHVEINPTDPIPSNLYDACAIVTGSDRITNVDATGDYPRLTHAAQIITVTHVLGSDGSDPASQAAIRPFGQLIRKAIYRGNANLSGLATIVFERGSSPLFRPARGKSGAAQEIEWEVRYIEDVGDWFQE